MDSTLILAVAIILVALIFDFVNGFHDAANSIATIVATRVLSPGQAVIWAAGFNFIAAFTVGTGVAKTVGAGMIDLNYVTPLVILAGLVGAITWDLITWWLGLPSSSSHALLGGYAGDRVGKDRFPVHARFHFPGVQCKNGHSSLPVSQINLIVRTLLRHQAETASEQPGNACGDDKPEAGHEKERTEDEHGYFHIRLSVP